MKTHTGSLSVPLHASRDLDWRAVLADYKELLKPGIAVFLVAMASASYLLALGGAAIDWIALIGLIAGTGLTAGGAGAFNHVVERRFDAQMERTASRPVASGRVSVMAASAYAFTIATIGTIVLAATTNLLTTALAPLTIILYIAVYTPLKRRSVHNTIVGAIPGAIPALGGAAAATGSLDIAGWTLFALLYLWQLPHFFAIAWMLRDDYERGGFKMLPMSETGMKATTTLVFVSGLLLFVVGLIPSILGNAGWLYALGMLVVGLVILIPSVWFTRNPSHSSARRLLLSSIVYVPAFLGLVILDHLLW